MDDALMEQLRAIICEALEVEPSQVHREASFFDDLGADSLDLVDLATCIEDAFGITINEEDYESFVNVGAACDHVVALIAAGSAAQTTSEGPTEAATSS